MIKSDGQARLSPPSPVAGLIGSGDALIAKRRGTAAVATAVTPRGRLDTR